MDVASWLRNLGLERYEDAFRENAVGADVLCDLTAEDLRGARSGRHWPSASAARPSRRLLVDPQLGDRTVATLVRFLLVQEDRREMLKTRFCLRFGIDAPIMVAPMGPDLTGPELVAAVCNAGGIQLYPGATVPAALAAATDPPSSHAYNETFRRELRAPFPAPCGHSGVPDEQVAALSFLLGRSF